MDSKNIVTGILAHVDAGKTTLSESMLYLSGSIRKLGRVDHKDAFLDTYDLERMRGITIFSKQAELTLGDKQMILLDTPGHVDFSAEMERTLQVLDYAVLVINGADGVQGHTATLWRLLKRYCIPVFLFVNKMDQDAADRDHLLQELASKLDDRCLDFGKDQDREIFLENLVVCDERLMENYLDGEIPGKNDITRLIAERKVFPCYFGSALKLEGVEELLQGLEQFTKPPVYPQEFGAKIFKITRDKQGHRLTHMKITGGSLKVKDILTGEEKADQIRIYSGEKYTTPSEASAGMICAVTGLNRTCSGEGLGIAAASCLPLLESAFTYQLQLPDTCNTYEMLSNLRQLEEEDPQLHIVWKEQSDEIHVQVMGEVHIEILKSIIQERFGIDVTFDAGSIIYKETISEPVEGVGHFEPLRHYAEVHLLLEPGEPGSGLQFDCNCSEDQLSRNWQRLVLTHLREKKHPGTLTGSEITDMKITLVAGKAHQKHTEGGDFREATYRAVRQGLKRGKSVLLEPVYEFCLEVPHEMVGRALSDIQKMRGSFAPPEKEGEMTSITGYAPVSAMREYQKEVTAYSRGCGKLLCTLKGYEPCENAEEIIASMGYDSEKDLENPTGSVFCSHGSGFLVGWEKVEDYMHMESGLQLEKSEQPQTSEKKNGSLNMQSCSSDQEEKELEEIFARTYGPVKREQNYFKTAGRAADAADLHSNTSKYKKQEKKDKYLLVDGYNILFAWEELHELSKVNLEAARHKLMDILCNYQGYIKCTLILVFDAYKVKDNPGSVEKYHNIHVVYTKEAETADQYIEKVVHGIGKNVDVLVATSDVMEQMIIWGDGARWISAQGLKEEIESVNEEIRKNYLDKH